MPAPGSRLTEGGPATETHGRGRDDRQTEEVDQNAWSCALYFRYQNRQKEVHSTQVSLAGKDTQKETRLLNKKYYLFIKTITTTTAHLVNHKSTQNCYTQYHFESL